MDNYKEATRRGLRYTTSKGVLTTEQIWDLGLTDLSNSIKAVKKILKKSDDDELSFLNEANTVDIETQLKFDILKDVYLTKKKEAEDLKDAAANKAHNQKILAFIAEKQEGALRNKSVEELEALLK